MKRLLFPAVVIGSVVICGAVSAQLDRRLYVTDRSGISVYDIDHGHKLLRKIDLVPTQPTGFY